MNYEEKKEPITLLVWFEKASHDGRYQYYLVNEDDLREQIRQHVSGIDPKDFILSSRGFITRGSKKIQHIIGVRKQRFDDLIELNVVPKLKKG